MVLFQPGILALPGPLEGSAPFFAYHVAEIATPRTKKLHSLAQLAALCHASS